LTENLLVKIDKNKTYLKIILDRYHYTENMPALKRKYTKYFSCALKNKNPQEKNS